MAPRSRTATGPPRSATRCCALRREAGVNPSPTAERTVLLLGTLDTKGVEFAFLRERLRDAGVGVLLADVGTLEPASVQADFTREQVGAEAGVDVDALRTAADRGAAIAAMAGAA